MTVTTLAVRCSPGETGAAEDLNVSIVLPCLNEESSVGRVVAEALQVLELHGVRGEVIVVDNNCTDDSAEVARKMGARVVTEPFPGYGAAIRRGIDDARGAVVVMADADCTYPLDRVMELVDPVLRGEVDVMIGSRLDAATLRSMPLLHRYVGTPALTALVKRGVGAHALSDSQSGFRAFRKDVITSLGLRSTGMEFASEMLLRATQDDLRLREVPLGYRQRVGESKLSTWSDGMRHLKLILRLSPHLVMWYPGWALLACSVLVGAGTVLSPNGFSVAGVEFQPIFLATILAVLGSASVLGAAMFGAHLPSASCVIRRRFAWVTSAASLRRLAVGGGAGVMAGAVVEGLLLVRWLHDETADVAARTAWAGCAQALVVVGALVVLFAMANALVLSAAGSTRRPAGPGPATAGHTSEQA